jgi:hypothetical protein
MQTETTAFFLCILDDFISSFGAIVLVRLSSIVLNRSDTSRHTYLVFDVRRKLSVFHQL